MNQLQTRSRTTSHFSPIKGDEQRIQKHQQKSRSALLLVPYKNEVKV